VDVFSVSFCSLFFLDAVALDSIRFFYSTIYLFSFV